MKTSAVIISLVTAFSAMVLASSVAAGDAEYIGAKKCKACHIKQYKSWEKTAMATSFESLKPGVKAEAKKKAGLDPGKDYTHDAACLECHTTGYGRPGGFRSIEETPDMANVQCEGCHGAGGNYLEVMKTDKEFKLGDIKAVGFVMPSEDEQGCLRCHGERSPFNERVDPKYKFGFKERLERIHEHFPMKHEH